MKRLLIIFLLVFCSFNIVYGAECDTSTYKINYYVNGGEKIDNFSTNNLSDIENLSLPVPVKGNDVFDGCGRITVEVEYDSYAAKYCEENNITYTYATDQSWLS